MRFFGIGLAILSLILVCVAFSGISDIDNYGSIASLQAETNSILMDLFLVIVALILAVFSATLIIIDILASNKVAISNTTVSKVSEVVESGSISRPKAVQNEQIGPVNEPINFAIPIGIALAFGLFVYAFISSG